MIYVTGDIHGDTTRIENFIDRFSLTSKDVIVILGDAGLNFNMDKRDKEAKCRLNQKNVPILCIHGNHEKRPYEIASYQEKIWNQGLIWYEPEFQNLLFAKDGEIYNLEGNRCLVIGGAYSVDKYIRVYKAILSGMPATQKILDKIEEILYGTNFEPDEILENYIKNSNYGLMKFWPSEQPTEEIKERVENQISKLLKPIDFVFTHTCPQKYIPMEKFLNNINQASIDNSTEKWLNEIEEKIKYKAWYCGHWHTNKHVDKMHFLFDAFECL